MKKVIKWLPSCFFALMMAAGGASVVPFGLAAALLLPIPKIKELKQQYKLTPKITALLATVLLVAGSYMAPTPDETPPDSGTLPITTEAVTTEAVTETWEETSIPETEPITTEAITEEPTTEATTEATTEEPTTEAVIVPTEPQKPENSTFTVHYIDVGQADATLVECDGQYMLIDGGNRDDSNVIYSVLKKAGVPKLDIVVGTHAHEDHIGGIPGAFNYTTSEVTLCPVTDYDSKAFKNFAKYAADKGNGIRVPNVGDTYSLGSSTVTILGVNGNNDTNNTSIVLKVQYGNTSFLFTGDAEREAEQAILNSGVDLSSTVLKVGHHGSDTSTTYPFLREIMPKYAVISVGKGNTYGHPTDDALSRLRDADVEVFRTDLNGDVYATSDGENVTITTDKNASREDIMVAGGGSKQPSKDDTPKQTEAPVVVQPEPEPEPEPAPPASGEMCWKSATGKKYHSINNCGNMNPAKAKQITVEEAERKGLTRCSKCY